MKKFKIALSCLYKNKLSWTGIDCNFFIYKAMYIQRLNELHFYISHHVSIVSSNHNKSHEPKLHNKLPHYKTILIIICVRSTKVNTIRYPQINPSRHIICPGVGAPVRRLVKPAVRRPVKIMTHGWAHRSAVLKLHYFFVSVAQ